MEVIVLVLVAAAPWCYGAVHPGFELLLYAGVALVLVLWGVRMLVEGCLSWKKCPVTLCLAGLFLIGVWQITPLSRPVLSQVSPGTVALYDQLLPRQPEVVSGAETALPSMPPGVTISLYPQATRVHLIRLLAVFLLFAAIRTNLATEAALWRLSLVALVNGAALSLFALIQFYSSPVNVVYWTYPSLGEVFGPFICHNHFSAYVNLCIGLGVGLLLSHRSRGGAPSVGDDHLPRSHRESRTPLSQSGRRRHRHDFGERLAPLRLLDDPAALWICAALALMVAAVMVSLSRGGFLALGGAALVCLLLKRSGSTRSTLAMSFLVIAALAVLLTSWLGFGLVQERVATLWKGKAQESRLPLWTRMAPLAKDFPLWGTGLGTFTYTEGLRQHTAAEADFVAEHAHNDYLEVLLECGVPGLLLSLLAVGLVFRLGYRGVRDGGSRAGRRLALGALFGFTALVIHSFGDFGLHIPAIALLATVLTAHLCARGDSGRATAEGQVLAGAGEYRLRLGGLAPLVGAATCLGLGLVLLAAGLRAHWIDRLQLAASRLAAERGIDGLADQVACLERAARLAPGSAELENQLGRADLKALDQKVGRLEWRNDLAAATGAVLAGQGDWTTAFSWLLGDAAQRERSRPEQKQLIREYVHPSLRHYLNARNRCPLLSEPHLVLSMHVKMLDEADSRQAYLERVKLLSGGDSEAWYVCGIEEYMAKEPARARASWRRCLELSDRYFPQILGLSSHDLAPGEIVEFVLPDRPELLLAAALQLYPEAASARERRPFLEKAVLLLETRGNLKPEELHVKARAYKLLDQPPEAIAAYQELLERQPNQADWRFELAEVFNDQGRLEDARRELVVVLAQQPAHGKARELMAIVGHELARKR
jgi:O-antigen ligase/tetratricopeptide (TPR) repeat protein